MADSPDDRAKLIANERAKLSATYLNGTAVAVLAVGGVAPLFARRPPEPAMTDGAALAALVCVAISGVLHWSARTVLGRLR